MDQLPDYLSQMLFCTWDIWLGLLKQVICLKVTLIQRKNFHIWWCPGMWSPLHLVFAGLSQFKLCRLSQFKLSRLSHFKLCRLSQFKLSRLSQFKLCRLSQFQPNKKYSCEDLLLCGNLHLSTARTLFPHLQRFLQSDKLCKENSWYLSPKAQYMAKGCNHMCLRVSQQNMFFWK